MSETFTPESSSLIAGVDYDPVMGAMTVRFQQGGVAVYKNVPQSVFQGFQMAGSPGGYWHREVKNRYITAGPGG